MGGFFNQEVMHLKKIPGSKTMEQMRKDYNRLQDTTPPPTAVTEPLVKVRKKRRVRNENGRLVSR